VLNLADGVIDAVAAGGTSGRIATLPVSVGGIVSAGSKGALILHLSPTGVISGGTLVGPEGDVEWQQKLNGGAFYPVVADDGSAIFSDDNGLLQVYGPEGRLRFEKLQQGSRSSRPVTAVNTVVTYEPMWNRLTLQSLDGGLIWSETQEMAGLGQVVAIDHRTNMVFVSGGSLPRMDATGEIVWSKELPSAPVPEKGATGYLLNPGRAFCYES
jgi:hypothetical protein